LLMWCMEMNEKSRLFNERAARDRTDSTNTSLTEPGLESGNRKA
jgi:hypothetical protein